MASTTTTTLTFILSLLLFIVLHIDIAAATGSKREYHEPAYLTPMLTISTITSQNAFYPYPTSSANCTEGPGPIAPPHTTPQTHHAPHPTQPSPHSWTHIFSSGPVSRPASAPLSESKYPSASQNTTYHKPTLTPESTTALTTTFAVGSSSKSEGASTPASGDQTTTTKVQSASATTSGPAEPLFTGSALRVPDLQVWKWNVGVSVGLGVMVMFI